MDEFIRISAVFEVPPDVIKVAVRVSKAITANRKVYFELSEHALYPQMLSYVARHGEKNVLDVYKPHLTIARFLTLEDAKSCSFGLKWGISSFVVDRIGVYISGDHGTLREPLAEFLLSS